MTGSVSSKRFRRPPSWIPGLLADASTGTFRSLNPGEIKVGLEGADPSVVDDSVRNHRGRR